MSRIEAPVLREHGQARRVGDLLVGGEGRRSSPSTVHRRRQENGRRIATAAVRHRGRAVLGRVDSAGLVRSSALKLILFDRPAAGEVATCRREHVRDGLVGDAG